MKTEQEIQDEIFALRNFQIAMDHKEEHDMKLMSYAAICALKWAKDSELKVYSPVSTIISEIVERVATLDNKD